MDANFADRPLPTLPAPHPIGTIYDFVQQCSASRFVLFTNLPDPLILQNHRSDDKNGWRQYNRHCQIHKQPISSVYLLVPYIYRACAGNRRTVYQCVSHLRPFKPCSPASCQVVAWWRGGVGRGGLCGPGDNFAARPVADIGSPIHCGLMVTQDSLTIGDRLQLSGGYSPPPYRIFSKAGVLGTLTDFIPGQNEAPAIVVQLDEPITGESISGSTIVLELRYVGAKWGPTGVAHVELCDFVPESKVWKDRRQGEWVESHATYQLVSC